MSGNDRVLIGRVFYVAICQDCRPLLAQPFSDRAERDQWAKIHSDATGHTIKKAVEAVDLRGFPL